jgi:hypothetical protein
MYILRRIEVIDLDGVYRVKDVKTRVEHECDSCHKLYPKGTRMSHASGIAITDDEVKPYSIYVCQKCVEEAQIDEGEEAYSEHLDIYG